VDAPNNTSNPGGGYEQHLLQVFKDLPVIDTHEHLPPEHDLIHTVPDIIDLFIPYVCDNFTAAGLPGESWNDLTNKTIPLETRWQIIEDFFSHIQYTTYFRAAQYSAEILSGEKRVHRGNIGRISSILADRAKKDIYKNIFNSLNIETVMTFIDYNEVEAYSGSSLLPVPTVSHITPGNRIQIEALEKLSGCTIGTLSQLEAAIEALFSGYKEAGAPAVKFGNAYTRTLDFGPPDRLAAEKVLEKCSGIVTHGNTAMLGRADPQLLMGDLLPLDDYLTHFMVGTAAALGLPVVFHTGIHAWNRNRPARCHAEGLTRLIETHPKAVFVILHGSIPFIDEAILLAAYFPNVYINMAWMHIINRKKTIDAIHSYLEMLPLNKIMAFGGDYMYAENISGHLQITFENLARALSKEMRENNLTEQECIEIARLWLYDNPKRVFNLP